MTKVKHLRNLGNAMIQVLLGNSISALQLGQFSKLERKLFLLFFEKKRYLGYKGAEVSAEYIIKTLEKPIEKKFEENIKYVTARIFKFLQKHFKSKIFAKVKTELRQRFRFYPRNKQILYAFFGFYFGEVAARMKYPIEKFFFPRTKLSQKSQYEKYIPKFMTEGYLDLVKLSPRFVKDASFFLEKLFLNESMNKIVHKVELVCANWEKKLFEPNGNRKNEIKPLSCLFDSKCKMPWSMSEVTVAISDVSNFLN